MSISDRYKEQGDCSLMFREGLRGRGVESTVARTHHRWFRGGLCRQSVVSESLKNVPGMFLCLKY